MKGLIKLPSTQDGRTIAFDTEQLKYYVLSEVRDVYDISEDVFNNIRAMTNEIERLFNHADSESDIYPAAPVKSNFKTVKPAPAKKEKTAPASCPAAGTIASGTKTKTEDAENEGDPDIGVDNE